MSLAGSLKMGELEEVGVARLESQYLLRWGSEFKLDGKHMMDTQPPISMRLPAASVRT